MLEIHILGGVGGVRAVREVNEGGGADIDLTFLEVLWVASFPLVRLDALARYHDCKYTSAFSFFLYLHRLFGGKMIRITDIKIRTELPSLR